MPWRGPISITGKSQRNIGKYSSAVNLLFDCSGKREAVDGKQRREPRHLKYHDATFSEASLVRPTTFF